MRFVIAAVVVAAGGAVCGADLRADFEKEYPAAVAKLEEGYKQVRMEGTHVFYFVRGEGGEKTWCRWEEHFELVRDGEMFREVNTTVKAPDEDWPVGSMRIWGDTDTQTYGCFRRGIEGSYRFSQLEAKPAVDAKSEPRDLDEVATVAYLIDRRERLLDVLKRGNRERLVVTSATFDGRDAIDVISVLHPNPMKPTETKVENYYFQPGTWASMGYQMLHWPATYTKVVRYQEPKEGEEVPRVKSIETYVEDSRNPGAEKHVESYDVKVLEFEKPEPGELELESLKKLGVGEVPTEEEVKARLEAERKKREEAGAAVEKLLGK